MSTNYTTTVVAPFTFNLDDKEPDHPRTGGNNNNNNGVKSTSAGSAVLQHEFTTRAPAVLPGVRDNNNNVKGGQQQQQLQQPHHQVPISSRDDNDNDVNLVVIHKVDNNLQKQPTCHDIDNGGGLDYSNVLALPQRPAISPTSTNDITITDTKINKNNKERRFPFGKSKKSDSSVISSSRSLQSSNTTNHRKKKNHFKTLFSISSSSNKNYMKQQPPPLVLVSTSPCNNNNNKVDIGRPNQDDDAHDSLDLSFSPLDNASCNDDDDDDDDSPPHCKKQEKQQARRRKQGRLSSSSSFFRAASSSGKNKSSSSSSLSLPQKDDPEQNPRPSCQEQQQQHGSSGTTTTITPTTSRIMTPQSVTSSPLSLEPLLLSESTEAINANNSNTISPCRSSTSTSMERLLSRQARLEQEMHRLFELEKASQRIQQRAMETTCRISQLTQTTMQMQQALQQSLSSLQQETSSLQQVEAEQARIEQATLQVAQHLQDSIVQGLRQMTSTSKTTTTMTTLKAATTITASAMNSDGPPPTSKAATVTVSTSKASLDASRKTCTASPIMQQQQQQQQQQQVFPRRRAATEDASVTAYHHCETFQSQDLMRTPLPEHATTTQLSPPLCRRRANTEPIRPRSSSSLASFMRVSDLEMDVEDISSSSLSLSFHATSERGDRNDEQAAVAVVAEKQLIQRLSNRDFFFLDENVTLILDKLTKLGLDVSTDESERFTPTRETQWLLQGKKYSDDTDSSKQQKQEEAEWPFSPWHAARDKDVLVWTGGVPHKGFGHDWPVVKARGIVRRSPRQLLEFLLDSKEIKRYNKMSQGRDDVYILQAGVDTKADDSLYGFAGDARILRALNKPKLFPKTMEMLSLWYSQPLEQQPGSYVIVSRSVWENEMGTTHKSSPSSLSLSDKNNNHNMLRCEMLLGVQLLRPVTVPSNKPASTTTACELTTITHVFSSGVPELMAKRAAPSSAANLIREIQALFP